MRALQLTGPDQWHIDDVPEPVPAPDEVVIDIAGCGICGTDLHTLSGGNALVRFPAIPGHEFGGTVTSVGANVTWLQIGDRIVVDPSRSDEHCDLCRSGHQNLCPEKGGYGSRYPGGFAEKAAVRGTNCVAIPDDMPWEVALLAEPLACVLHGVDRLGNAVGRDAVVFGAGPIGLLVAIVLRQKGTQVAIVERSELRRNVARKLGFDVVVDAASTLPNLTYTVAVDATGVPAAIEAAFSTVARGGSMLFMGVAKQGSSISIDPYRINWQELTIVGSMAINHTFGTAVELLARIQDEVRQLVTHEVPLEDFEQALELVRSQGALKILVRPSAEPHARSKA
ncbi:alcohol dehydrogenase catalytic domain-containing protein [Subtercola lobariae]|uniref:Alcohol dehydrogenase n=1 Tax=Subtercola lobariae TaxID=1588641 RepID=A0A917EUZ3_9MICO|nr:alcohol dehydrogenase catalytic domain-containing protein [Subtercola lobariae]GGF18322.1 alcohol dehydrogenase [Subtercola lobariae]